MTAASPVCALSPPDRARIDRAIRAGDYLRRSPFQLGGLGGHKEWLHFCIHSHGLDLLVNFSMVDDVRPTAQRGAETGRITILTRDRGSWDGGVEAFEPCDATIRGGEIHMTLGDNHVSYAEGVYRIAVRMHSQAISIDLTLRPVVMPALSNNIAMDAGTPINWLVLPRLLADGSATLSGRAHELRNAVAYHDHNWGHFAWGRDFAWEWCYALSVDPANIWSLVFVRLLNRARNAVYKQGLFLWRKTEAHRIFRSHDMRTRHEGFLPSRKVFKIPRVMALVTPGTATDVPAQVEVEARGEGDRLGFRFEAEDVAQVVIPSDTDLTRVTIINEVAGHLETEGVVRGERVSMSGPAIFEFIRA
ncbi:hypothetical protein OAX78_01800 [Planctomycetota bacterium]|nr:hypothetical protein [Planctomycetota bacterium]